MYFPGHTVCASIMLTSEVYTIESAATTPAEVVLYSTIPIALLIICTSFLCLYDYIFLIYFAYQTIDRSVDSNT